MVRFLIKLLLNSFALWLTTLIVIGVNVVPYSEGTIPTFATYLLVALVFGFVNSVVGGFVRVVAFPVYILTLGLISLIVNGFLLMIVAWFSDLVGFGLMVDDFWWGVLGALVLGVISWILGVLIRPVSPRS